MDYLHSELTKKIIAIAISIHKELGPGFKEVIYCDALELEFHRHLIPFEREKEYYAFYNGIRLQRKFKVDFVLFGEIIVEIKASPMIFHQNFRQILNYMKVSGMQVGLLLNFGANSLQIKRVVNSKSSA